MNPELIGSVDGGQVIVGKMVYQQAQPSGERDEDGLIVLDPDMEEGPLMVLYRPGDQVPVGEVEGLVEGQG